jgi:transposase
MEHSDHLGRPMVAARTHDTSLFVALELSKSTWLIAVSLPGNDRVSKYRLEAADTAGLLSLLARLNAQAVQRCRRAVRIVAIHEAGLDGFWVHRLLEANGVESHVVDAASIAVDRCSRRAKTDRIDVEKLLRNCFCPVP